MAKPVDYWVDNIYCRGKTRLLDELGLENVERDRRQLLKLALVIDAGGGDFNGRKISLVEPAYTLKTHIRVTRGDGPLLRQVVTSLHGF